MALIHPRGRITLAECRWSTQVYTQCTKVGSSLLMVVKYYCLPKSHHDTGGEAWVRFSYQYRLVPFVLM